MEAGGQEDGLAVVHGVPDEPLLHDHNRPVPVLQVTADRPGPRALGEHTKATY